MAVRGVRWGVRLRRWAATAVVVVVTAVAVALIYQYYVTSPWTRDGRVRVLVANVAPQVSGQIVELHVVDNQVVHKGDVLYVIDPFDFRVSVDSAKAQVQSRAADLQVKQTQAQRRQSLTSLAASVEEKQAIRRHRRDGAGRLRRRPGPARPGPGQPEAHRGAQSRQRLHHQPDAARRRLRLDEHAKHLGDRFRLVLDRRLFRGDQARPHLRRRPGGRGNDGLFAAGARPRAELRARHQRLGRDLLDPGPAERSTRSTPGCGSPSACRSGCTSTACRRGCCWPAASP